MTGNDDSTTDATIEGIDRRTFLKAGATTAAAVGVTGAGYSEMAEATSPPQERDGEWAASGTCWDCHQLCGQRVKLQDGRAVELRGVDGHPRGSAGEGREGTLCSKGHAQIEKAYDPDRLKQPYVRENGSLRKATWEEAWSKAASMLETFAEEHGPEKLLVNEGYDSTGLWEKLFMNLYGSPNKMGHRTICHGPWSYTWDWMAGYGRPHPDHANTEYIINWGRNEMEAFDGQWQPKGILDALEKNDATMVTIDPRYTQTAAKSDTWVPIEPRTDGALALAMGHVIVEEELYDEDFVENWTYGFEEYKRRIADKTPEWAADVTGVDPGTIREIAVGFANAAPQCYISIWSGITNAANGQKAAQNIHALNGLVGNLDRPGGLRYWKSPVNLADPYERRNIDLPANHEGKAQAMADYEEYPFHHVRGLSHTLVPVAVDRGDIAGAFMYWYSPHKNSNTEEWIQAMEDMDLLITIDAYWNAMSRRADVVFPESSQLEKPMLGAGGPGAYSTRGWITGSEAAIEPQWNTKPGFDILKGLAEAMGYGEYFPWETKTEKINDALAPSDMTLADLDEESYDLQGEYGFETWKDGGFDTASGKFQFTLDNVDSYAKAAEQAGISTAPEWIPPERFGSTTSQEYPLEFTDTFVEQLSRGGDQSLAYSREQLAERWGLEHEDYEGNYLLINPEDAAPRGIEKGDMVTVESANGSMTLMANVTEGIRPGFVTTTLGWGKGSIAPNDAGGNSMMLHDTDMISPTIGMAARHIAVEVHGGASQ